jgi:hypothetical protein
MEVTQLFLKQIEIDESMRARVRTSQDVIDEYADDKRAGAEMPPVVVFRDKQSKNWLGDGQHRYCADELLGRKTILAEVREGTQRDAFLYSIESNHKHGLRFSLEDRVHAANTMLKDKEWSQWTDREIARQCRLSPTKVGDLRKAVQTDSQKTGKRKVTTRNGTTYEMDTAAINRKTDEEFDRQHLGRMLHHVEKAVSHGGKLKVADVGTVMDDLGVMAKTIKRLLGD